MDPTLSNCNRDNHLLQLLPYESLPGCHKEGFEKEYKKDFHQRIIAVPKWYTGHLTTISKDIFLAMPEDYDYETGFIRERTQSVSDTVITLSL